MNYVNDFKSMFLGKALSNVQALGDKAKILSSLKEYGLHMRKHVAAIDDLVLCLTSSLADVELPEAVNLTPDYHQVQSDLISISDETAQHIYDNVQWIVDQLGSDPNGMTLTDANGYGYQLILTKYQGLDCIATLNNPQRLDDVFLVVNGSDSVFNPILRSVGFCVPDDDQTSWDIKALAEELCDWLDIVGYADTIDGTLDLVIAKLSAGSFDTILDKATAIYDALHASGPSDTIVDLLTSSVDAVRTNQYYGIKTTVYDLIKSLATANTLNSGVVEVIGAIGANITSLDSLSITLRDYLNSSIQSVKSFADDCMAAFNTGGWYGLANYIIAFIRGTAQIGLGDDGSMQFTDNTALIPAEYIAGIVSTTFQAMGAVASAAAAVVSPIIGVITSLIGSVILAPFKAVAYDAANNIRVGLNELPNSPVTLLSVCPAAFMQCELPVSQLPEAIAVVGQSIVECSQMYLVDIPGGKAIMGPSSTPNSVRVEFHPSLADGRWDEYLDAVTYGHTGYQYASGLRVRSNITVSQLSMWRHWQLNAKAIDISLDDSSGTVLNESSDQKLYACVLANFGAMLAYFYCDAHELSLTTGVDYGVFYTSLAEPTTAHSWSWEPISLMMLNLAARPDESYLGLAANWSDLVNACVSNQEAVTYLQASYSFPVQGEVTRTETENVTLNLYSIARSLCISTALVPVSNRIAEIDNQQYMYEINLPKYDSRSFYAWVAVAAVATVVVIAGAALATVAVKKWRMKKRLEQTAKVSNAYENVTDAYKEYDPSDPDDRPEYHTVEARKAAVKAYNKSVVVNNLWANVTGGTKYSKAGYWDSDAPVVNDSAGGIPQQVTTILNSGAADNSGSATVNPMQTNVAANDFTEALTLNDVYKLINGGLPFSSNP